MSERFLIRGGSRHTEHGSWRAGFHWPVSGDKEVVLSREQVLELKADRNVSFIVIGRTERPLTEREDRVNDLRKVEQKPVVDESFLDHVGFAPGEKIAAPAPAPISAASPAPAPGAPPARDEPSAPHGDAGKPKAK